MQDGISNVWTLREGEKFSIMKEKSSSPTTLKSQSALKIWLRLYIKFQNLTLRKISPQQLIFLNEEESNGRVFRLDWDFSITGEKIYILSPCEKWEKLKLSYLGSSQIAKLGQSRGFRHLCWPQQADSFIHYDSFFVTFHYSCVTFWEKVT